MKIKALKTLKAMTTTKNLYDGSFAVKFNNNNVVLEYFKKRGDRFLRRVVLEEFEKPAPSIIASSISEDKDSTDLIDLVNLEKLKTWSARFMDYTSIEVVEADAWLVNGELLQKKEGRTAKTEKKKRVKIETKAESESELGDESKAEKADGKIDAVLAVDAIVASTQSKLMEREQKIRAEMAAKKSKSSKKLLSSFAVRKANPFLSDLIANASVDSSSSDSSSSSEKNPDAWEE